jgi:hypothetical protein
VGSKGEDRDTAEVDMKGAYRAILVREARLWGSQVFWKTLVLFMV